MTSPVTPPFELGEAVRHPTLNWSAGLRVIGMTISEGNEWSCNVTDIGGGGFWIFPAHELERVRLRNGTCLHIHKEHVVTVLPNGLEVEDWPNEESAEMAVRLGYGEGDEAIAAMTRAHDPLHSHLMEWLGQPYSYSLMGVAGCDVPAHIAALEEDAVLAVQKLKRALETLT